MKRLLLFLLLLGVGALALWLAIGDEAAVVANTTPQPATEEPAPNRTPGGVTLQQGKMAISLAPKGELSIPHYRTIPLPGGGARHELVYRFAAEDSAPVTETLQQFDRVTLLLYEHDQPTSRLRAARAFLELDRDQAGKASLKEDKEIDLRDAVFETLPGARVEGLKFEFGNARIRVGEDDVHLRTATEDEPVTLTVAGEHSGTLHGKGLQARLPRNKTSVLRLADVEILHDPVLETTGMTVRATGRMHYREDLDLGAAMVTLDGDVQLDLQRIGLPRASLDNGERSGTRVRGDSFTGWLRRDGSGGGGLDVGEARNARWERLQLTGAPASVELEAGRLLTPRITVLPGPFGDPWLVTAHGGESRIEQTQLQPGGKQTDLVTGTSARRIHLVRTGSGAGAQLRSFGFPQWTLRPLNEQQVVMFEGASRLDSGARTVTASKGLHVFHRDHSSNGVVRGFGDVRITQSAGKPGEQDLVATGNDGFVLRGTDTWQTLQLGPPLPQQLGDLTAAWRLHRYQVRYGPASADGVGVCRFERDGERTRLRLRAPGTEIRGRIADRQVELDDVRQLEVVLAGQDVVALEAAGLPARARRNGTDDAVAAAAPRLVQIGPRSLRLTGVPPDAPADLWSGLAQADALPVLVRTMVGTDGGSTKAEVRGPWIEVHHVGGNDVIVDAIEHDGVRPVVDVELLAKAGAAPTHAHCSASRLRALPFAIAPAVRLAHVGGVHGALAQVTFAGAAQPWLVVDDVPDFRLDDPVHGAVEGSGKRLVLSQGAEAGLFVGDPDRGTPAEVRRSNRGREMIARGARVRVFREQELQLTALRTFEGRSTFLLPSVTLHETGSGGPLSHMNAVCQGNIDVLPDRVAFGGPVTAYGLDADGAADPDGIGIDARELVLLRDAADGKLTRALGQDVRVDWSRLQAHAAEVELDIKRTRCIARDPAGAVITLPGGQTFTAPWLEANYETMSVRGRNVSAVQARDTGTVRR